MRVSVCIATYNGEKFIKKQLDSILIQLMDDDEIIISDDSSTDNTVEIIKGYNDRRITLLTNNKYKSPIYNFENALRHCSGEFIFLSDQDDMWVPDKIKTILPLFNHYNLIISDCSVINADEELIYESFFEVRKSGSGILKNLYRNTYLGCCMAFDKNILQRSLPFPTDIPMHDIWIGMIAELYGTVKFLKHTLVLYRRHENSATITGTGTKSKFSLVEQFKFRFRVVKNIVKRHMLKAHG